MKKEVYSYKSATGNKYKPGTEFCFRMAIPCAEVDELALLIAVKNIK